MKKYILFIIILFLSCNNCAYINEDYYSQKQRNVVEANKELQRLYLTDATPVFKIDFPEGGQMPKGTSIQYYGERKPQIIQAPKKEYHPIWGIINSALPFGFGWLTAREYRLLNEDKYKYMYGEDQEYSSSNKGITVNVGDNGVVALDKSSISSNSGNTKTNNSTNITDSYKLTSDQSTSDQSTKVDMKLIDKSDNSTTITGNTLYNKSYNQHDTNNNKSTDSSDNSDNSNNSDNSITNPVPTTTTTTTTP